MVERIYLISTSQRFMVEAVTLLHGRSQTKVIGMPEEKDQGSTKVRTTAQTVLRTLWQKPLPGDTVPS